MTSSIGVSSIGARPLAGTWARAKPSVGITAPTGTVTDSTLTFAYSSPVGRAQYSYQYQVRSADGSTVLFDSGIVVSASGSVAIAYLFAGGTTYQVWARASDLFDTSDWDSSTFTVDLVDVNDYPLCEQVGSVYEIGINGQGYMLADRPPDRLVKRQLATLEAPRFATGDTPFSEAVERYTFLGHSSFKGGAGQIRTNRPDSDPTRYNDSFLLNPFEDDCLQLVPWLSRQGSNTYSTPYLTVMGTRYYFVSANGELTSATATGAQSSFTITGAAAPLDLTSDGSYWYYADGANIYRNSTNADPGAAWATHNATRIRPCLDRMVITYVDGSSNLVVSTLDNTGAEEVAGGRFKYLDADVDIPDLVAGDGYLWFIVNRNNQSQVHYWKVGTDDTYAAVAFTLPTGQKATALGYYLGNLFIRAVQDTNDGVATKATIYRCVPSDGVLTAEKVLEWSNTVDNSVGGFAGSGRFVFFSWRSITTGVSLGFGDGSGVGAIDLSTGGWCRWSSTNQNFNGNVRQVGVLGDRVVVGIDSAGAHLQGTSVAVSEGWLTTSLADMGSGLTKVYDEIVALFDPLPADVTVTISYTLDNGVSYTDLDSAASTSGQQSLFNELAKEGRSIGLKFTLAAGNSGDDSPKLRMVQTKLHALSLTDEVIQFPINCSDQLKGLNGQLLPDTAPGSGLKRLRILQALMGSRIKLQDIDWPVTQVATIWELVGIEAESVGEFSPKENRRVDSAVATITLRRAA